MHCFAQNIRFIRLKVIKKDKERFIKYLKLKIKRFKIRNVWDKEYFDMELDINLGVYVTVRS